MTKIVNAVGTEIDYEAAVNLMDDDIREDLHMDIAPCSEQQFFFHYCERHLERHGEEFEPNKRNPVW